MRKVPFSFVKLMSILLLSLPFAGCWMLYYDEHILAANSERVTVLMMLTFLVVCYFFCQKMDCFRVSVYQIRDIAFGQVLATMITDICMYVIIWMLSVHMPNLIPGLMAWVCQCIIGDDVHAAALRVVRAHNATAFFLRLLIELAVFLAEDTPVIREEAVDDMSNGTCEMLVRIHVGCDACGHVELNSLFHTAPP